MVQDIPNAWMAENGEAAGSLAADVRQIVRAADSSVPLGDLKAVDLQVRDSI